MMNKIKKETSRKDTETYRRNINRAGQGRIQIITVERTREKRERERRENEREKRERKK